MRLAEQQTFKITGLVPQGFVDARLFQLGAKLGRMDAQQGRYLARYDDAESPFIAQALRYLDPTLNPTLVPPLLAREFIPTSVKANPGADEYVWIRQTRTGVARLITGGAMDLPRSTIYQETIHQPFYTIGAKIEYSYFELLAMGMAIANNMPIDIVGESLRAAMEAIAKKLDIIAAFGTATPPGSFAIEVEADVGLVGLLNNPNTTAYTVAPGAFGFTQWAFKTSYEVLLDLNGIFGGQVASTYQVHRPDRLLVPVLQFEQQLMRPMTDAGNETILSFFLRTRREAGNPVEVRPWYYMAGAGASGEDLMIAYKTDPRMFEHILSMDASPLPATTAGLVTTQPVVARTAGIVTRYPLSISGGAGI